jgi:transcriptional regulator with XRE-family HTH domain
VTSENGRAFNEWLRTELKAKKMSQRQLAHQSGVDHSTISRLIRGDRMPSLGTATRLARGLRSSQGDSETAMALAEVSATPQNPTARVEYALRADEQLSEPQVRQIMEYYLAVRIRRFGRAYQPGQGVQGHGAHATHAGQGSQGNGYATTRPAGHDHPAPSAPSHPPTHYRALVPVSTVAVSSGGSTGSDRSSGRAPGATRPTRAQGR